MKLFTNNEDSIDELGASFYRQSYCIRKSQRRGVIRLTKILVLTSNFIFFIFNMYVSVEGAIKQNRSYITANIVLNCLGFFVSEFFHFKKLKNQNFNVKDTEKLTKTECRLNILSLLILNAVYLTNSFIIIESAKEAHEIRASFLVISLLALSFIVTGVLKSVKANSLQIWMIMAIPTFFFQIVFTIWSDYSYEMKFLQGYHVISILMMILNTVIICGLIYVIYKENTIFIKAELILKDILFNIPSGLVLLDKSHLPVFANSKLHEIFSLPLGSAIKEILPKLLKLKFESYKKADHSSGSGGESYSLYYRFNFEEILNFEDNRGTMRYYTEIETPNSGTKPGENSVKHFKVVVSDFSEGESFTLVSFNEITATIAIIEANKKKALLNNILCNFSHELKTPINNSLSYLGCALRSDDISADFKETYIEPPINSLTLLEFMIGDILDFLKLEVGQLCLSTQTFSPMELMKQAYQLTCLKAKSKGIKLNFSNPLDLNLFKIKVDKERLLKLITNFILNCIKYTFIGEVNVKSLLKGGGSGEREHLEIMITDTRFQVNENITSIDLAQNVIKSDSNTVLLANENTEFSLMINKLMIEKLFDKNEVFKCSLTNSGVAYSLSIPGINESKTASSKKGINVSGEIILESIDYRINEERAELELAKIPQLRKPKTLTAAEIIPEKASDLKKKNCNESPKKYFLVADDEAFNLFSLEMVLSSHGISSFTALNGREAVETALKVNSEGKLKISLALLDLNMPIMGGYECAEELLKLMNAGKIVDFPLIACSANDSREDQLKAKESGMVGFISKPFTMTKLKEALTRINLDI